MFDNNVKDSSIYRNPDALSAFSDIDGTVRLGMVRSEIQTSDDKTRYIVDVFKNGNIFRVSCMLMQKFGGWFNYEEFRIKHFSKSGNIPPVDPTEAAGNFKLKTGDMVVVAFIGGDSRSGIILGGILHPARKELTKSDEIAYISEFNGINTQIKKDGTYKVTWKGTPLNDIPGAPPIAPQYDPLSTGSFWGFDKKGSFTVSDNDGQLIKIKKQSKEISLVSGDSSIAIRKGGLTGDPGIGIWTKKFTTAADKVGIKADSDLSLKGMSTSLIGTTVAIGNSSVELIDQLLQLIDAFGTLVVTSPTGPCQPVSGAPTWAQIMAIKTKLSTLKASVKDPETASIEAEQDNFGDDIGA